MKDTAPAGYNAVSLGRDTHRVAWKGHAPCGTQLHEITITLLRHLTRFVHALFPSIIVTSFDLSIVDNRIVKRDELHGKQLLYNLLAPLSIILYFYQVVYHVK